MRREEFLEKKRDSGYVQNHVPDPPKSFPQSVSIPVAPKILGEPPRFGGLWHEDRGD